MYEWLIDPQHYLTIIISVFTLAFGASMKTIREMKAEEFSVNQSLINWIRDQANAIPSGMIVLLVIPEYYQQVPHPIMLAIMLLTGLFGSEVTEMIHKMLIKFLERKIDDKVSDGKS